MSVGRGRLWSGGRAVAATRELIDRAGREGIVMRALGGTAVAMRCGSASPGGLLARSHADIDFVAAGADARRLSTFLPRLASPSPSGFNALTAAAACSLLRPPAQASIFGSMSSICVTGCR